MWSPLILWRVGGRARSGKLASVTSTLIFLLCLCLPPYERAGDGVCLSPMVILIILIIVKRMLAGGMTSMWDNETVT